MQPLGRARPKIPRLPSLALHCPPSPQEHQKLHQVLLAEENKRTALLKKLYILEVRLGAGVWGGWSPPRRGLAWCLSSACSSS